MSAPATAATRPRPAERHMQAAQRMTRLRTPTEIKARILELHEAGQMEEQTHEDLYHHGYLNSANKPWRATVSEEAGKIGRVPGWGWKRSRDCSSASPRPRWEILINQ